MLRRFPALLALALLLPACSDGGSPNEPPPPAPTGLVALDYGAQSAQLSWVDPTPDEYGFHIWYRPTGVGSYALLRTVAVNVTTEIVDGLDPATTYDFQVTAYNARGDSLPSNTATASTGLLGWTQLPDAPLALQYAQGVHDTLLNRMILFGGGDDGGTTTDDLVALDLNAAAPVAVSIVPATATRPGPRFRPSLIYDSQRHSLILFGGLLLSDFLPKNDVWEFDLLPPGVSNPDGLTWTELLPTGLPSPAPLERYGHSAIYDPVNGRMVVFGGFDDFVELDDLARLQLPASGPPSWETLTLTTSPPTARDGHSAVYDPLSQRMLVFAGNDSAATGGGAFANDLWALPLSASTTLAWSLVASAGSVPSPREGHMAVFDPINRQMIVFGGREEITTLPENRVWTLSLEGSLIWNELSPLVPSPGPRRHGAVVFDTERVRMLLWAGADAASLGDIEIWALGL